MRSRRSLAWPLVCIAAAAVYTFLLAPIIVVVIQAFNDAQIMVFPPQKLSLRWFTAFFHHGDFLQSFRVSLVLGFATAFLATVLGTGAAYGLVRLRRGRQAGTETLLLAPLYTPRVLIGLSLLLALSMMQLTGTFLGMLLGHVLITLPYVVRNVAVSLNGVDPAVEEASRVLGATPIQTFLRVTMPLIRSGLLAGAIFAFIISFSDVYLAIFIAGPDTITLPLRMFNFMEWEQSPIIAVVATAQVIVILGLILIAEKIFGLSTAGRV